MRPSVVGLKAAGAVIVGKTTTTEFGWKSPGRLPAARHHAQSVEPGLHHRRFVVRRRRGGRGRVRTVAYRHRCRRLDPHPRRVVRPGRAEADLGRVPLWPASAFPGVSCAGPMTRTVRDAALMLSAMARYDLRDPFCMPDDGARLARRHRGWRRRPAHRRAAPPRLRRAGGRRTASPRWNGRRRCWPMPAPMVEEANPQLPDTRCCSRASGASALARLVAMTPEDRRGLLDPGILEVARTLGGMSAIEFLDAEALRAAAAHEMARLHQRFDLVLCPTVPAGPPLADAATDRSGAGAVDAMGAVDLHLQHDAPAGDHRAARAARERAAERGATCRGAVSRRPGAARGTRDRSGGAVSANGSGVNRSQ